MSAHPEKQKGERSPAHLLVFLLDKGVNAVVMLVLVFLFALGCYALWDSHAVDVRADAAAWQPYKPVEPEPLSFWELQKLNPEVRAWVSVYGTNIDYPVCQSEDIDKYLNTDAKGEHSLSGALFLEPEAAPDFSDFATFIHGHHMDHDVMFGQITDFKEQSFFDEHRYGNLFVENQDRGIEFICCLQADAYDATVYRSGKMTRDEGIAYLDHLRKQSCCKREVELGKNDSIVLLTTCSTAATNARTILVGRVCDETFEDTFVTWPNTGTGVDKILGWFGLPWYAWVLLAVGLLLLVVVLLDRRNAREGKGRVS